MNTFFTKLMTLIIMVVGVGQYAFSQTPTYYNNNTASTSNSFPLNSTTNKLQWIYGPNLFKTGGTTGTASGGGTITKIYFRLGATANATSTYADYTVSLGQNVGTTTTWSTTAWTTGLTQCFYRSSFQMTGAATNSWYVITLQNPFPYDANLSLVFELTVSSGTGCTVAQAGSTTQRKWGTYTSTAPTSMGSGLVDFGFDLAKGSNDGGISAITTPLCAPAMIATITNFGVNQIDSAKVAWSVDGSLQNVQRYTSPLASGKTATINLSPNYNFTDGNTYTVKAWTTMPNNKNDTLNKNDTFKTTFVYQGPAGIKSVSDIIKCGPGRVTLGAVPENPGDSIVWFDAASGGNVVARGKNALTPPLVLGVNTYYAQAFKIGSPIAFANAMTPSVGYGSTYSGGFADITPNKGIIIDSFDVQMTANIQNATWNVWMRTGTYVGYNTSSAGWTKIANNTVARVRQVGTYWRSYIRIPETALNQGQTYGFYITSTPTTPCSPWCNAAGAITISNSDITVMQAQISYGATEFATGLTNYNMTWETHYRPSNCPSSRYPVKVTVKPSPNGASIIKSTPFVTTQLNSTGSVGSPDIVAEGHKLTYEITPPTGYNNIDYGTTWIMSNFTLKTKGGKVVTSLATPTMPAPSGSANAKFTFTPDASVIDSTIIMTVSVFDLGPHYCDSLLTRNIFVAPRPKVDFRFGQPVCDGDNVIFTNTSTVSSGYMTHKWDINTGNPADTAINTDVVFVFPTYGTYDVKLVSTTVPYGYTDTKTITVTVTEIPKVGFNVFNACLGDSVKFVNKTSISTGSIAYKWDFGNGTSSTKTNPGQKYTVAGGYKVTLTATSNGCSKSLTKNAQQFSRPVAKYSIPSVLCDKTDITFSNNSTIAIGNMGYNWNFGDGGVSGFANPTYKFSTAGVKTVKMKVVSEFGCADSITKSFTLAEAPVASFTTGSICNLTPTAFTFTGNKPSGALTNFLWDFAGEGTTTVENPNRLFSIIGKKLITLTLTSNNGCSNTISKEIDVKLQSKANFDATDVCNGDEAVFTNTSLVTAGNLNYNWKFGDGTNSSVQSPRHLYSTPTSATYNVTLVAIVAGGCSDSITKPVTVNARPTSDFTFSTNGRLVSYNALQAGNTTYQWNFGDGGTATSPNTQYHYLNSFGTASFKACLTVTNASGCSSQTCKEVSISSGIDGLHKENGIRIYPNPSKGLFTVKIDNVKSDISLVVYSIHGDVIRTIDTSPLRSIYPIDLGVSNGVYIVKVTNGGYTSSEKITINR